MKKYKIVYLIPHLEKGGPVAQMRGIITYLDRNRFEPYIVTLYKERQESELDTLKNDAKIIQLNLNHKDILAPLKLRKKIKDIGPDIVHSESNITDIMYSLKKSNISWVHTLHNYMYEDLIMQYGNFFGKMMCFCEKKAIRDSDMSIACSYSIKNKYGKEYEKVIVIQNGLDLDKWRIAVSNTVKQEIRKKLGINQTEKVFISTGALIERKNPLLLINAFKLANLKDTHLVILGDGALLNECKKHATQNIHFLGKINNVSDYLAISDTFVSLSSSEGLPYAVLEAACMNLNMLLSNIPQHKEIFDNDKYISWVDINDIDSIINAFVNYKASKEIEKYNLTNFTAKKMSLSYQEEYIKILKEKQKWI